jgi:hypothetical protein
MIAHKTGIVWVWGMTSRDWVARRARHVVTFQIWPPGRAAPDTAEQIAMGAPRIRIFDLATRSGHPKVMAPEPFIPKSFGPQAKVSFFVLYRVLLRASRNIAGPDRHVGPFTAIPNRNSPANCWTRTGRPREPDCRRFPPTLLARNRRQQIRSDTRVSLIHQAL